MVTTPRNIIILIADSLRFDSVYSTGIGLPYIQQHAIAYTEARASGCWTLPATASIFTGLMPHEHGATEQTRGIHLHVPTLAEQMKARGYSTHQVTANIATTDIFGLHRGFDEVHRIWKFVDPKFTRLQQLLVIAGKPRLRQKLFSRDMLMAKMSEDLEMSKTWLQHTFHDVFAYAREIIRRNEAQGKRSFLFLNLMETHFPYHIAPTFKLSADGLYQKIREVYSLYHLVNQTFLIKGKQNIARDMLQQLKQRQQTAWKALAPHIDAFAQEMHQDTGNIVVFGADHGENFGETGWTYHFSNVTDAGNKVPLFYLPHHHDPAPRTVDTPVSTRHLYHTLLEQVGATVQGGPSLLSHPEESIPIMQSCWYNNHGKTLPQFKYNQIAFLDQTHRYLWRNGAWYQAPLRTDYDEPTYAPLSANTNPIEECISDRARQQYLRHTVANFEAFTRTIKF